MIKITNLHFIWIKKFHKGNIYILFKYTYYIFILNNRVEMVLASCLDYDKEFIAKYKIKS